MAEKYSLQILNENDYKRWNKFVSASPDGSIYSTPEYLDVLCEATSANFRILAVIKNDEIFGGISLYERSSIFGTYVAPRLLLYYNGLVLKDFATKYPSKRSGHLIEIMSIISEKLSKADYGRIFITNRDTVKDARVFKEKGWAIDFSYTYVVPLGNLNHLWSRVEQNLRRLIKRCLQQNVCFSKDNDFDGLFQMHLRTHHRKGSPLYLTYDKFKRYYTRLHSQNLCQIYHARLPDGRSIASQLVLLGTHPITHTVCAGADEAFLSMGANAFLRWKVFEDLSKNGYLGNDLTDAALNPVAHFKSQLGGDLRLCLNFKRSDSIRFKIRAHGGKLIKAGKKRLKRSKNKL